MTQTITRLSTEDVVISMLRENTGRGICDSGDAYGRNWERAQSHDFKSEPEVTTHWSAYKDSKGVHRISADTTVSLYHWMTNALEFDPEMQAELDEFLEEHKDEAGSWLQLSDEFVERLIELGRVDPKNGAELVNTYNDPDYCWLSQVLQYHALNLEDGDAFYPTHLIVHVHGGCDVRGGYTAPKCFTLTSQGRDYFRDWMRPTVLTACDEVWHIEGYQDFDPGDRNTCGIDDPFKLPAYEIETLKDEMLAHGYDTAGIVGVQIALEALGNIEGAVKGEPGHGILPVSLHKEQTLASLAERRAVLQQDLLTEAIKGIGLLHQHALFVPDPKHCYLVDGNQETADELRFYTDF